MASDTITMGLGLEAPEHAGGPVRVRAFDEAVQR